MVIAYAAILIGSFRVLAIRQKQKKNAVSVSGGGVSRWYIGFLFIFVESDPVSYAFEAKLHWGVAQFSRITQTERQFAAVAEKLYYALNCQFVFFLMVCTAKESRVGCHARKKRQHLLKNAEYDLVFIRGEHIQLADRHI
jgi:hypothetical protein